MIAYDYWSTGDHQLSTRSGNLEPEAMTFAFGVEGDWLSYLDLIDTCLRSAATLRTPPCGQSVTKLSRAGLEFGPDILAEFDDFVDYPVDGFHDGFGEGLEELLDLLGDAADAEDGGQGADEDG